MRMGNETPAQSIRKGMISLAMNTQFPFMGALVFKLKPKEDVHFDGLTWVNGVNLGYNPKAVAEASRDELLSAITSAVLKCALGHPFRRGYRNWDEWQNASGVVTDHLLNNAGMHITDAEHNRLTKAHCMGIGCGMAIETVFDLLHVDPPPQPPPPKQPKGNGGGGEGSPAPPQDGNGGGQEPSDDKANDGQDEKSEPDKPNKGNTCELRDAPKESAAQIASDWGVSVAQATTLRGYGTDSGRGIATAIRGVVEPQIGWMHVLERYVSERTREDYSWSRPNRRHDEYMPSLYEEKLPPIIEAIDVSGSILKSQLEEMASESGGILEQYDTTLRVMYFNTGIVGEQEFTQSDLPITFDTKIGGGTSFIPVFEKIEEDGIQPIVLLIFTDMEGAFPHDPPPYPVIWVDIGNHYGYQHQPPFGEVVKYDNKRG